MTRQPQTDVSVEDVALAELLQFLKDRNYVFVTPTGGTHARMQRDPAGSDDSLRDIFGWTRLFTATQVDPELMAVLRRAGIVEAEEGGLRLTVRVSTVEGLPYLHSAPTRAPDAVFLGPDSYRYARFLRQALGGSAAVRNALDIGTGAGVGAMTLAAQCPMADVTGSDINRSALRFARLNAAHSRISLNLVECSGLPGDPGLFDVIAANPPYIAGAMERTYRDGGGALGAGLALEWVEAGLGRLAPGGRFLLYTGSAIVRGQDHIRDRLERLAAANGFAMDYDEIDPDVFSGTLRQDAYRDVERIAAIGAIITAVS